MLKNFRTYQLSLTFYRRCRSLNAKGAMRDQLERASLSIALNLAAGSAQLSKAQRKKFYQISFASFKETECLLELLDANNETKNQANTLGAHLYKLLHAL